MGQVLHGSARTTEAVPVFWAEHKVTWPLMSSGIDRWRILRAGTIALVARSSSTALRPPTAFVGGREKGYDAQPSPTRSMSAPTACSFSSSRSYPRSR